MVFGLTGLTHLVPFNTYDDSHSHFPFDAVVNGAGQVHSLFDSTFGDAQTHLLPSVVKPDLQTQVFPD